LSLPDAGDCWVIDRSQFFGEFMELTPKLDDGTVAADLLENFVRVPLSKLAQGMISDRQFGVEIGLE